MSKGRPAGRRTQGERTAQTRAALITAARRLFGAEGFAEVGAERIAREAGMTRGALYHQFADKAACSPRSSTKSKPRSPSGWPAP